MRYDELPSKAQAQSQRAHEVLGIEFDTPNVLSFSSNSKVELESRGKRHVTLVWSTKVDRWLIRANLDV